MCGNNDNLLENSLYIINETAQIPEESVKFTEHTKRLNN